MAVCGVNGQTTSNLNIYVADKVAINPDIFGVNNDWKFITNEQFPAFATTCTNLGLGVLRYPGGWESEWVNWATNTAPGWNDAPATPGASITTVKANYANYSVVVPTQTALNQVYNSAAWNSAIDNLKLVAKDAIERAGADKIKYVEIGNEWWLQYAGGASRANKLINYSKTAMKIAGYLAAQYPNRTFNILINGDFTEPQEFTSMKQNFTEAYDEIDGIALHTYTGYQPPTDKLGFAIQTLGDKIDACSKNFNQNKKLIIYCSEWMAARAYNENRIYMQAANIIPDIIQIYARHGVDAAAYWPPINTTAPGVGMFNWNATVVYPCGQILGDMASSYKGEAVRTVSENNIGLTSALTSPNKLVLYVTGKDNPTTNVTVTVHNFQISAIEKVEKFRPADYAQTDKAAPYVVENAQATLSSSSTIDFNLNGSGAYEIFKIVVQGEFVQPAQTELINFESPVNVVTDFGASFGIVQNPDMGGLNKTSNCGQIGRTSTLWYELVDIPCNFSIPANEYRYVHVFVKYPAQPDLILRLNQTGNEGNVRAQNSYVNIGQWQDMVFEYAGGATGVTVNYLRFMGDCGYQNDPAGFVLNNTSNFGYIDEIVVSQDPTPRSVSTPIITYRDKANYIIYSQEKTIYIQTEEDRNIDVWIYNMNGSLIKKYHQTTFSCHVPVSGLYLVRIGDRVEKVIVR